MPTPAEYLQGQATTPLLLEGDALEVLRSLPTACVDCCITSPPYWQKRQYANGGIGLEATPAQYVGKLLEVTREVRRVLKPYGVFWLNLGDSYHSKSLQGIPWRLAIAMLDEGWILRNDVIWHKCKGGMNASGDRFAPMFEHFFFFVKQEKYYFDAEAIRAKPRRAVVRNGAVVSATGVSGVRYRRQIELSTSLSEQEKREATKALDAALARVMQGELADFRMVIRNTQRATHSDSALLSGRARELKEKGFYFLFYHPDGTLPGDVWEILPEDTQNRVLHFAPYPEELCIIPIKATCPAGGVVLDPFCGTGTTLKVAQELNRKTIGIDLSPEYLELAQKRICRKSENSLPFLYQTEPSTGQQS